MTVRAYGRQGRRRSKGADGAPWGASVFLLPALAAALFLLALAPPAAAQMVAALATTEPSTQEQPLEERDLEAHMTIYRVETLLSLENQGRFKVDQVEIFENFASPEISDLHNEPIGPQTAVFDYFLDLFEESMMKKLRGAADSTWKRFNERPLDEIFIEWDTYQAVQKMRLDIAHRDAKPIESQGTLKQLYMRRPVDRVEMTGRAIDAFEKKAGGEVKGFAKAFGLAGFGVRSRTMKLTFLGKPRLRARRLGDLRGNTNFERQLDIEYRHGLLSFTKVFKNGKRLTWKNQVRIRNRPFGLREKAISSLGYDLTDNVDIRVNAEVERITDRKNPLVGDDHFDVFKQVFVYLTGVW